MSQDSVGGTVLSLILWSVRQEWGELFPIAAQEPDHRRIGALPLGTEINEFLFRCVLVGCGVDELELFRDRRPVLFRRVPQARTRCSLNLEFGLVQGVCRSMCRW